MPQTGKMHQIRVHLAHRGYPITNDPIYSRENWAKKSTDEFSKELTDVLFRNDNISALITKKVDNVSDVDDKIKHIISTGEKECSSEPADKEAKEADTTADTVKSDIKVSEESQQSAEHCTVSGDGIKQAAEITITPEGKFCLDGKVYARIPRLSYEEGCPECSWIRLVPDAEDMFIFLHAVRYELADKFYVSPLPEWCPEEWIPEEFHQLLQMSPSA